MTRFFPSLIIGADGRESQLATLLNFEREQDPPELFTGGFQLQGDIAADRTLYFYQDGRTGRGAILVSNKPRNYRAYTFFHRDALSRRFSGARDYAGAIAHFRDLGLPGDWQDALTPHGIHATFDGAHRWISDPVRGNCVLVGDAAAASDPVWGCGLSRTLRDVRLLRDRLLGDGGWLKASRAYAADHCDFFNRLRHVEHLCAKLYFAMGDEAESRRQVAFDFLEHHPEQRPDTAGSGPESLRNAELERLLSPTR